MTERKKLIEAAGGLAFPRPGDEYNGGSGQEDGMTLLDWFAGQALMGMLAWSPPDACGQTRPDEAGKAAYKFARAMLAARSQQPQAT